MIEFSYRNEGSRMVVLRCIGPSSFFLERASLIESTTSPDACIARIAVSRPPPGPLTKTLTLDIPTSSIAFLEGMCEPIFMDLIIKEFALKKKDYPITCSGPTKI